MLKGVKTVEGEDVEDNAIILKEINTVDGDVLIINTNKNQNIEKNNKKHLGYSNHTRYSPKYSPRFSRYPRYKTGYNNWNHNIKLKII